jgi:nucleoside phosphorylase
MHLINMKNLNEELLGKFNEWVELLPKSWLDYLSPYKFSRDMKVNENEAILFFNELYKKGYAKAYIEIKCPHCTENCIIDNDKRNEKFECEECGLDFIPREIQNRLNVIYSLNSNVISSGKDSKINPLDLLDTQDKDENAKVVDINIMRNAKGEMFKVDNNIRGFKYDIAIITAVEVEFKSVYNLRGVDWKQNRDISEDTTTTYYEGVFKTETKELKVILAQAPQMGMPAAAVLSTKLINNFCPKYLAMVGIAAGVRDEIDLGDILVAEQCWDYGSGKYEFDKDKKITTFYPDPKSIPIHQTVRAMFQRVQNKFNAIIEDGWQDSNSKPKTRLKTIIGPLASGAAVLADEGNYITQIKTHSRKLKGIDMETYGVYYAAANCSEPMPKVFSIKAICDFADSEKKDSYQSYAAYVSANFLYNFALDEL